MGKGRAAGRVGSGQTFCRQSRVELGRVNISPGRVGSGPRKVTRGQLWTNCQIVRSRSSVPDSFIHSSLTPALDPPFSSTCSNTRGGGIFSEWYCPDNGVLFQRPLMALVTTTHTRRTAHAGL